MQEITREKAASTEPKKAAVDFDQSGGPVYFDHNATTPLDPRVREAMWPFFIERHGNPSSAHAAGRQARSALERARGEVAALLGAAAGQLLFTSSGTEANNMVVRTLAEQHRYRGRLLINALEHPSVHAAAERARCRGMEVDLLAPDAGGLITADAVAEALRPETRLVALMLANNELGTIQPVRQVAELCRPRGVPLLCDAVQAAGKIPVDAGELGADYLSIGGHKCYGPPGVAALWTRPGAALEPWLVGGSQEGGLRASTENLPAIVGLGRAAELARTELDERHAKMSSLRDAFEAAVRRLPGASIHAEHSPRLPNTSHVAFDGISGHGLMLWLDAAGFAVSTGSACHAGEPRPSRALLAMGISEREALGSLRVSFGTTNRRREVERFVEVLADGLEAMQRDGKSLATA